MKKVLRILLTSLVALALTAGALFGFLIYAPAPEAPFPSGSLRKATLTVDGRTDSSSVRPENSARSPWRSLSV